MFFKNQFVDLSVTRSIIYIHMIYEYNANLLEGILTRTIVSEWLQESYAYGKSLRQ
jgi:hypothetical protein